MTKYYCVSCTICQHSDFMDTFSLKAFANYIRNYATQDYNGNDLSKSKLTEIFNSMYQGKTYDAKSLLFCNSHIVLFVRLTVINCDVHRIREKRCRFIFDYNCRISWLIFAIFSPVETGMNNPQSRVICLFNSLITS